MNSLPDCLRTLCCERYLQKEESCVAGFQLLGALVLVGDGCLGGGLLVCEAEPGVDMLSWAGEEY